jgi:hypothetical protein
MTIGIAVLVGESLIQKIGDVLQVFDATDTLVPPSQFAPHAVVGDPRPSSTRLILTATMDLAVPAEQKLKFKLVLPQGMGNPELLQLARWQPFCTVSPADAASAAQMDAAQIYSFPVSYDPASRVVTVELAAGVPGTNVTLSLSVDFKHSLI